MTLGPFYENSTPVEPALITVHNADGTARDLTGCEVEGRLYSPSGDDVSEGSVTQINDDFEGIVQFDWPVPSAFTEAGLYLIQLVITAPDPDFVDYTTAVEVEVREALPPEGTGLRVTPDDVAHNTATVVSQQDCWMAQQTVSLFVGRDLADDEVWNAISAADQHWIELAICHQAAFVSTPSNTTVPVGATSVKAGDVSITYGSTQSTESILLAPLTRLALSRCTFLGGRTIHAVPFLGYAYRVPIRPMWASVTGVPR